MSAFDPKRTLPQANQRRRLSLDVPNIHSAGACKNLAKLGRGKVANCEHATCGDDGGAEHVG